MPSLKGLAMARKDGGLLASHLFLKRWLGFPSPLRLTSLCMRLFWRWLEFLTLCERPRLSFEDFLLG